MLMLFYCCKSIVSVKIPKWMCADNKMMPLNDCDCVFCTHFHQMCDDVPNVYIVHMKYSSLYLFLKKMKSVASLTDEINQTSWGFTLPAMFSISLIS